MIGFLKIIKESQMPYRSLTPPKWEDCQRITPQFLEEIKRDLNYLVKGRRSKKEIIAKIQNLSTTS